MVEKVRHSPATTPPVWAHCGHGATPEESTGCRGRKADGYSACLAHLGETDRTAWLAGLSPGDDIDLRGTSLTQGLLNQLLDALRGPGFPCPQVGRAAFSGAVFTGDADFANADFAGEVDFSDTVFAGRADFGGVTIAGTSDFIDAAFHGDAHFDSASFRGDALFGGNFAGAARFDAAAFDAKAEFSASVFTGGAWFGGAGFAGGAWFTEVVFVGDARFGGVTFAGEADFVDAVFTRDVRLGGAVFYEDLRFDRACFEAARRLGPLVCGGAVSMDTAEFMVPVTVEIAASEVSFRRTRWESTAALRLRRAEVGLAGAVLQDRITLVTYPVPFTDPLGDVLSERSLKGRDVRARVTSLDGVDAAHLTLTDVDLAGCDFAGVVHLGRLRVEDTSTVDPTDV